MIEKLCRWLCSNWCWWEQVKAFSEGWRRGCDACLKEGKVVPPPPWSGKEYNEEDVEMPEIDLILADLGEIYKNAHDIAMRTHHPLAHRILNDCNELATQYQALKKAFVKGSQENA